MSLAASVSDSRNSFFQPRRFFPRGRSLYRSALLIRSSICSPKVRNGTPSLIGSSSAASRQLKMMYLGFSDLNSSSDAENAFMSLESTLVRVVVRQFVVLDMKRISFCSAQALRFGVAG